ncbi:hypothetical protein M3Y98_01037700 [Aphelenchoides besseyi]|nr:hypothetical protein M3Y98_01037700 [Aphelenchoides besseyi]KAI6209881.1 hypothetical protein M3Y96_00268200 [Aphelenchoides besseyi]
MENKRRKKTVGLFLRPMQRLMDEATGTVDRFIGEVARVVGGNDSIDQNSPITYWRTDYDLSWEDLATYSGVKSLTSTISNSPKAEIECPSCHEEPPRSPTPLSTSNFKHSNAEAKEQPSDLNRSVVSVRTDTLSSDVNSAVLNLSTSSFFGGLDVFNYAPGPLATFLTVDYLDHFLLPDQSINVGDVNSLIDLFGGDLSEMTEETLALRLLGYALCYTGERPELFEILLRALCNSEKKEVRKVAFFQISELASFTSFNGHSFDSLIDLFCSYLRRIEQFNSSQFIEYATHWTSCDDEEQPPTLNDLISIEDILDQSLRLMYETATELKMRRQIVVNFCKLLPILERCDSNLRKNIFSILTHCSCLFVHSDFDCNNPIKNLYFDILWSSNRRDVQQMAGEGLAVHFVFVFRRHRDLILQTHDFHRMTELAAEIRENLVADPTIWRHRQRMGLFIEHIFKLLTSDCPLTVLFGLFSDDLLDLSQERIPILRQLFPRALSHVNLAYAQWLHIDLADRLVCRLAELMVFDPDREVRFLALSAFRRGCEMYTGDKDEFEMRQMVELAVLHDFRPINKTYKPSDELLAFNEPWNEQNKESVKERLDLTQTSTASSRSPTTCYKDSDMSWSEVDLNESNMSTGNSSCQFYLQKNKRNCQNAPKEGHQFCYRHLSIEVEGSSREVSGSPAPSLKNEPVASHTEQDAIVSVAPQKLFGTSTESQPLDQPPSSPELSVQSDPKLTPRSSPVKSKQSDSSPSKRSTTSKLSVSTAIEAPEILNKKNATRREKLDGYSLWLSRCIKANDWEGINNIFEKIQSNPRSISSSLVSGLALQLSSDDVLPFLKIAANVLLNEHLQRTFSGPVIAGLWFKFVDDVMRKHMRELSMIEHLDSEIGELLNYVECRTKNLEQIMRLQGKLQFLFEQTTRRNEEKAAIHDDSAIVFEDGDSDDENIKEVEEIANNSTSDLFTEEDGEKRKKLRNRRSTSHSTSAMEID